MTIHESLRSSISHRELAKDLWDQLKKRFSVSNGPQIQQLKQELANCKQRGDRLETYFGRINKIWETLQTIKPIRRCRCGNCTCDFLVLQEKDYEDDKVHQFLLGLDDGFQAIRSSLLSRQLLPSVEEAYNIVRQEEDLISNTRTREDRTDVMAYAMFSRSKPKDVRHTTTCPHCQRTGHVPDQCFTIVGYPEWWGDRPRRQPNTKLTRKNRAHANTAITNSAALQSKDKECFISDKDRDTVVGISNEQWEAMARILNVSHHTDEEHATGKKSPQWIFDSGCSHHMTGNLLWLINIKEVALVVVILADGTERLTIQAGTVSLSSQLTLKTVFYVPELKTDLVSVGQLLDENESVIQMMTNF